MISDLPKSILRLLWCLCFMISDLPKSILRLLLNSVFYDFRSAEVYPAPAEELGVRGAVRGRVL